MSMSLCGCGKYKITLLCVCVGGGGGGGGNDFERIKNNGVRYFCKLLNIVSKLYNTFISEPS